MIAVGHANRSQLANLHYYDVTYAISNRYFAKKYKIMNANMQKLLGENMIQRNHIFNYGPYSATEVTQILRKKISGEARQIFYHLHSKNPAQHHKKFNLVRKSVLNGKKKVTFGHCPFKPLIIQGVILLIRYYFYGNRVMQFSQSLSYNLVGTFIIYHKQKQHSL